MSIRTNYVARTALGTPIATFETRSQALEWAEDEGDRFPGWVVSVETEQIITTSRVLRRDRSHLQSVKAA